MVTNVPVKPLPLLNLYLADEDRHLAGKDITFKDVAFSKRVSAFGLIDKSIPYPSGLIHTSDAKIELADTDGQIRGWLDDHSPYRRLAEIIFEFEHNALSLDSGIELPITHLTDTSEPLPEAKWKPIFTGEIYDAKFPPGKVILYLASVFSSWMDRLIPMLITRDNFPNLPIDLESAFSPIIFGRVEGDPNIPLADRQGVIRCHHVDTELHLYNVARHTCFEVIRVYKKRDLDRYFHLISPLEYSIVIDTRSINGITYDFTHIQMATKQDEGTIIAADVSGVNFRWNFGVGIQESEEVRNPADCIASLIYYLSLDEIRRPQYDDISFGDTTERCEALGFKCDGALTEQVTGGVGVSMILSDFTIDLSQDKGGRIGIHLYDEELDADSIIPIDSTITVLGSVNSGLPEKPYNLFKYRYMRQNSPLTEWTAKSNTAGWGAEDTLENRRDQLELISEGATPQQIASRTFKTEVNLNFIRDEITAKKVIKRMMEYHTLRSYQSTFKLPGPPFLIGPSSMDLGTPISFTHFWGVRAGGWVSKTMKIHGLAYDLQSLEITVRAVVVAHISDADLVWTHYTAGEKLQKIKQPQLGTLINGTPDLSPSNIGHVRQDASPQVNINDYFPEAPSPVTVTDGGYDLGFRTWLLGVPPPDEPTGPVPNGTVIPYVNVKWQESIDDPRYVSGYVPNLAPAIFALIESGFRFVVGTLDPDEKPTLTAADVSKVIFYASDFDRMFLYVGGGGTGWRAIGYDAGSVGWFGSDPGTVGWAFCDGSDAVMTLPDGTLQEITTPDLVGVYPKGSLTYTGPDSTASIIGNHTHGTGSLAAVSHTHTVGIGSLAVVSEEGSHYHNASWDAADYQHDHLYNADTGNESAKHFHSFGGGVSSASTIDGEGAHAHDASWAVGDYEHFHNIGEHDTSTDGNHDHSVTGDTGTGETGEPSGTVSVNDDGVQEVGGDFHTHSVPSLSVSGSTSDSGGHHHTWGGSGATTDNDGSMGSEATSVPVDVSGGAHNHNVSGDTGLDSVHHHHSFEGTTGLSTDVGSIEVFVGTDNSRHDHHLSGNPSDTSGPSSTGISGSTGTAVAGSTDYEPRHMGLMPFLKL